MSMNDLQVDMNNTILSATAGDTNTITSNNKVEIKIGILLHDDTRQGLSGVQIAVNEINQWDIIPGAFVTLIEKDVVDYQPIEQDQFSSLAISQAIYSVVSLIQQGVIGIIGDVSDSFTTLSALMTSTLEIPQCSYSATAASLADKSQYDYFFRTIPTDLLDVDVVISFILSQNWTTLGILYTTDAGLVTQNLISKTKKMGILSVKSSQTFEDDGNTNNIHASIDTLMSLGSRVVFIASKDSAAKALLIAAVTGHVNNETVWLIMGNASNVTHQLNQHVDLYNRIIQTRLNSGNQSSPTTYENAVEQLAWSTNKLNLLTMEHLFVGGVFIFEQQTELTGYPPYDTFRQKLSQFDPSATVATTYQSGLAYSCMMVMAHGFGQLVRDSVDSNCTLQELTSGQLKSRYSLALFNDTGFTTGPQGPVLFDKNGDIETGNFKIFNLHHGSQVTEIGHDLGGTFNLFRDPIYFDETKMPPSGTPTLTVIKAGITMPISIATASMAMIGIITTLMVFTLVIKFRHHPVFKLSSPIFCILELLGLLLSYISVPLFFISSYSIFTCFMLPITFYIGLSLILGTMISRNYRVYKTMNNVYNKGNNDNSQSGNIQLLKISCFILAFNTFILACWLVLFGNVKLSAIPVSTTVVVNTCSYDGPGHIIFVALLSFLAGIELCLSVYLALKTKSFGGYSKYSEHKQLGLSVYNIFFSALIGFIIFFMPTTDFYTRYYLTSMTILWASTFSLCVLFFPKIFKILSPKQAQAVSPNTEKRDDHPDDEKTLYDDQQLLTMNRMIATSCNILVDEGKRDSVLELSGSIHPTMETYQEKLPVQYVLRYFPFLARWQMSNITFLPQVSFLSIQLGNQSTLEKPKRFCYSHASIISNVPGNYVFKVHRAIGSGHCDLLIQVSDQGQLSRWLGLFVRKPTLYDRIKGSYRQRSVSVDKTHCGYSISDDSSDDSSSKGSILDKNTSKFTICSNETSASSVTQLYCKQVERSYV